ncbi:MAG: ribonuclease P protein component [Comamonadaceae bacterium]|nr:ribonuclease P protein component [Comamonadaceae bacterium]
MAWRRLKTRAQFQALLRVPPVARSPHFAWHHLAWPAAQELLPGAEAAGHPWLALFSPASGVWLSAMAPKRWARRSVTRNTVRRQIHALEAAHASALPPGVHLVRLRAAFATAEFPSATSVALKRAVRGELTQLLAWAARAIQSQSASP